MKSVMMTGAAVAVLAGFSGVTAVIAAPAPTTAIAIPERASDFQLTDTARMAHELYYFRSAPAVVLMSQTNGSKVSREGAAARDFREIGRAHV